TVLYGTDSPRRAYWARRWFPRRSPADGRPLGWWRGSIRKTTVRACPGALSTRVRSGSILLVDHVALPVGRSALIVGLLHGQVEHRLIGHRAVPVLLADIEAHRAAGAELDGLAAGALHARSPLQDVED